ncbi:hypothetical protein N2152v2_001587 [Parachlorella kessleri]
MAADAGEPRDVGKLLSFFAQEMQLFFGHIHQAVVHYGKTGELPQTVFKAKAIKDAEKAASGEEKKKRKARDKPKRKPSAFNVFVKEKMEELKAAGVKPPPSDTNVKNALFGMAVAEWGKLSVDQKKDYSDKYVASQAAGGEVGSQEAPTPAAPKAAAAAPAKAPAAKPAPKTAAAPTAAPVAAEKSEPAAAAEPSSKPAGEKKSSKRSASEKERDKKGEAVDADKGETPKKKKKKKHHHKEKDEAKE